MQADRVVDEERRQTKLRVRIVDSETGAIVGSVLTDTYKSFDAHARAAVEALKADVLGGVPRGYYSTGASGSTAELP